MRNVSWTMTATASRVVAIGLALLLISRMVSPGTMAVYGLGWAVSALGLALSQSGAAQALIALKEITPQHVSAARWLSFAVSGGLGLLVVLFAPLAEHFYRLDGLHQSLLIAAASIPIMSLSTVDVAVLQRKLEFRLISIVQSIAAVAASMIAVILAYFDFDLFGLYALQGLAGPITFLCFRLIGRSVHFSRCNLSHLRDLWQYGSHLTLGSLSGVIWLNFPQFLIGRIVGAEALGQFVFCQRIVQLIATQLGGVINTVLFPTFAALTNPRDVVRAYLRTAPISMIVQAVPLLLLVVAPTSFLMIYGGVRWVAAGEILRLLAIMQLGLLLGSNVFPTFQALGRPAVIWKWNVMLLLFQVGLISLMASSGIIAVSQCLAASTIVMPLCALWLMRTVDLPFRDYVFAVWPITGAAVAGGIVGACVAPLLPAFAGLRAAGAWTAAVLVLMLLFLAFDANGRAQFRSLVRRVIPGR